MQLAVLTVLLLSCASCARGLDRVDEFAKLYAEARRVLSSANPTTPEDTCTSSLLFGPMHKEAGGASASMLMGTDASLRFTSEAVPLTPSPLWSYGRIYVSYKYRFIYVQQAKSSSSHLLWSLKRSLCGTTGCTPHELMRSSYSRIQEKMWQAYFVFTWVRNPFQRALAMYEVVTQDTLFTLRDEHRNPTKYDRCTLPPLDYVTMSSALAKSCDEQRCCMFWDNHWLRGELSVYLNEQSHSVFTTDGKSMVDYIGRSEHFDEDFDKLLSLVVAHSDIVLPIVDRKKTPPCVPVHQFNATHIAAITQQYALDMYIFGFI